MAKKKKEEKKITKKKAKKLVDAGRVLDDKIKPLKKELDRVKKQLKSYCEEKGIVDEVLEGHVSKIHIFGYTSPVVDMKKLKKLLTPKQFATCIKASVTDVRSTFKENDLSVSKVINDVYAGEKIKFYDMNDEIDADN